MLLIDSGNSRIKWAYSVDGEWRVSGVVAQSEVENLRAEWAQFTVQRVLIANVAGEAVAQRLGNFFPALAVEFIRAQPTQCGVKNGYQQPAQLGADRWAALIAAWHRVRGECLVVSCGTATTVDTLSATGEFLGGLILPGIELMQHSLQQHTAQLTALPGSLQAMPRNTADAVYSGAIQATLGAIRQQAAYSDGQKMMLSGGAAALLQPHLGTACEQVDHLVLRGLAIIGQERT
jgi:type III pantothenate kinase